MNYTYAQMKQMQEQAFERVREMQKKADRAAKQAMSDIGSPPERDRTEPPASAQPPSPKKVPDEPRHYSLPVEFPDRPAAGDHAAPTFTPLSPLLPNDRETALLVTLMMLLNAENADKELIFALMYILNG